MTCATAAQTILGNVRPSLAIFADTEYTPKAEIFDNCLANHMDVISYDYAHKSNTLMFKRYTLESRDEPRASLSAKSWEFLREMEWTGAHCEKLRDELYSTYAVGDWYSAVGTQFNKRFMDCDEIRSHTGLDPAKKTAFVFSHILWDAPLSWGKNLFRDYQEWLTETVRAACLNDKLNWVIKIHPANIGKGIKEDFTEEPAESVVLREQLGELPPHVRLIPAECDISTYSLFELMDYCLTVRGTVGIEAAIRGIPVLAAGTGRYDHKGFTIDSETRGEYLENIARIDEIPRLSRAQMELAQRYAYGLFVLRPLRWSTVTFEFRKGQEDSDEMEININSRIKANTKEDWYNAPDVRAMAEWLTDRSQADFFNSSS